MSTIVADPARADLDPPARPSPGLMPTLRKLLKPAASLQLTVGLLAVSMGLIFFGTLAQKTYGIWTVVDKYFWSWVVFVDAQPTVEFGKIFFGLSPELQAPSWLKLPYPGGKLIGGLMFVNLLAAHFVRMKFAWRRAGVIILHSGIVLLFVGEFITREFQVEQQMVIPEGGSANFAFDHRHPELAFVDSSDPKEDKVTVVSDSVLKRYAGKDEAFDADGLPVSVQVVKWFPNSELDAASKPGAVNYATAGIGKEVIAVEKEEVSGVSMDEDVDQPSAYVALYTKGTTDLIGTYLVSLRLGKTDTIEVDGKSYEMSLRFTHYYKPFRLSLTKLHADYYPGTNPPVAKHFASDVILDHPAAGPPRPVSIAMNEPMRYHGETFYQSRITTSGRDTPTTVLQVVRNPGWILPYLACGLVGVGMLIHFGLTLAKFLGKTRVVPAVGEPTAPRAVFARVIPVVALVVAALYVVGAAMSRPGGKLDLTAAAKLPVLDGGRVKPLDSVARKDLRLITHAETYEDANGKAISAIQWYLDTASEPIGERGPAAKARIFRVENDQLWDLLKLKKREGLRYAYEEIGPRIDVLEAAGKKAVARPAKSRDLFDAKVLELGHHVERYQHVQQGAGSSAADILPPGDGLEWRKPGEYRIEAIQKAFRWAAQNGWEFQTMTNEQKGQMRDVYDAVVDRARKADPGFAAWEDLLAAYRDGKPDEFRDKVEAFAALSEKTVPAADRARASFEVFLNNFAPFYRCAFLYGLAGLLTLAGWAATGFSTSVGSGFRRAAFWVLLLTFVVHAFGLIGRMYLMERWLVFVTNLYSSAVFIGWTVAGICLVVERLFPIGLGNAVAAGLGVATSIVAHNLSFEKDTLEMMVAVLDTNFWLATHVTTVVLGYSATYVASVVGLAFVVLGVFTPLLRRRVGTRADDLGKTLGHVTYGIVCLATLFSFVGTVLGGIWADQSWGRFWGWDPKENGAVLIVAWNALILHARWCGLLKDRGTAVLAIAGAVITTWSYFGTNQLGVGLHNYGFNNDLVVLCVRVWAVSILAMLLGLVPTRYWVSYAPPAAAAARRV